MVQIEALVATSSRGTFNKHNGGEETAMFISTLATSLELGGHKLGAGRNWDWEDTSCNQTRTSSCDGGGGNQH